MAFLIDFGPAALSCRLAVEGCGAAFEVGFDCLTGGFFAVPEDACELSVFFARVTPAFASRRASRMLGAVAEYCSARFDINASILASRFRTFLVFMTAPSSTGRFSTLAHFFGE